MPNLFLETFDLSPSFLWIVAVAVFVVGAFLYYSFIGQKPEARENHDLRSHIVNDSNYNVSREGVDGHRAEDMSSEEAQQVAEGMKENGTIPSRDEFFELRDSMNKS